MLYITTHYILVYLYYPQGSLGLLIRSPASSCCFYQKTCFVPSGVTSAVYMLCCPLLKVYTAPMLFINKPLLNIVNIHDYMGSYRLHKPLCIPQFVFILMLYTMFYVQLCYTVQIGK